MSPIFVTAWSFQYLRFSEAPIWAILFQSVYSYFYFQPLYLNLPFFSLLYCQKSMYLVHLFKYRLRSLLLTLPILHYSLPVNSLLFVLVLLHCPFFCHMTSVTQSSPDLLRLLISSSTLSVPPWIWHDSIIQFGCSSFSSRFPLTPRPLV